MIVVLAVACVVCAGVSAVLFCMNLAEYREPPPVDGIARAVSVIVPARNEEKGIEACVASVLANAGCAVEVIVIDDASTDRTAEIVETLAAKDARVRPLQSQSLPQGWNGKQHACWQGAQAAAHPLLCFVDADVRLAPDVLARMAVVQHSTGAALVSGFPWQETHTFLEWLLLPMIHFVLLGLLPMRSMRRSASPMFAAGCGQFLMCDREAYFRAGGHAAIRQTMHDGLLLPQLFRKNGMRTRLADLTWLAGCRMYTSTNEVWRGLLKNATEGFAKPVLLPFLTALFLLGSVVPFAMLLCQGTRALAISALALAYLPRMVSVVRFRQPLKSALLHPLGIVVLLAVQWTALWCKLRGRPAVWRERAYSAN